MNNYRNTQSKEVEVRHLKAGDRIDFIHLPKPRKIAIIAPAPDGKIWITWEDGYTSRYAPDCILVIA